MLVCFTRSYCRTLRFQEGEEKLMKSLFPGCHSAAWSQGKAEARRGRGATLSASNQDPHLQIKGFKQRSSWKAAWG